ncbi:DUF1097 family protein [Candidatus Solincola tengchongensis]|uniref:DUF1097 family protein n=1 Tax=Candidatus Solincola tengchongensis TaxID=2900693 RepID=UPI00257CDE85|nr:DUF1097 family protein [Candidatus Solincola tengchongensis]
MENLKRNAILALVLAVAAFFWIWLFDWLGAKAYWAALVAFGVCMAYGPTLMRSLPWMTLGSVLGVLAGLLSFVLYMLVFPLYYGLSVAIAGAIFVLIAGLVSIPKMREMLPMYLVGWGVFLGAVSRFDYLLMEKPVEALPRALTTLFGTVLSLLFGMLLAAVLDALIISPRRKEAVETSGSGGE